MAKPQKEIMTIDQANEAMKELDKIDSLLARFIIDEARAVSHARAKYQTGDHAVKRQILILREKELRTAIGEYAAKDRKLWAKQTVKTPFGSFGFRKGQPCVCLIKKTAKTFTDALALVRNAGIGFIRKVEELDKEQIIQANQAKLLPDDLLARVGLKVDQGEKFFVKTNAHKELKEAFDKLKSA